MKLLLYIIIYTLISYCLMRIAKKSGMTGRLWFAYLPVCQELLLVWIVGKRWKWILLFLVPAVNIWAAWVVWGAVARKIGRSAWYGRMMIVPFLNIFLLLVLAFDWKPRTWPPRLRAWWRRRREAKKAVVPVAPAQTAAQ